MHSNAIQKDCASSIHKDCPCWQGSKSFCLPLDGWLPGLSQRKKTNKKKKEKRENLNIHTLTPAMLDETCRQYEALVVVQICSSILQ